MPLSGEAKLAWQREYRRKKREAARGLPDGVRESKTRRRPAEDLPKTTEKTYGSIVEVRAPDIIVLPDELAQGIMKGMESRVISEGSHSGKKFKLLEWQVKAVWGIVKHNMVGVSMARGNGKTTFFSCLACEVLDGAMTSKRATVNFAASSLDQARVLFAHTRHFMGGSDRFDNERTGPKGPRRWRVIDNSHQIRITDRVTDTIMVGLGSDSGRAHGRAPTLVLADEPAQWKLGGRKLYNALKTSRGKQQFNKFAALGTMPEDENHWFSKLMLSKGSASGYKDLYTVPVPEDDEIPFDDFDPKVWRMANPSYDHNPELREIISEEAMDARESSEDLASFRALRMNMGTPELTGREKIVSVENWRAATARSGAEREGPLCIGVDLGGGVSMTAWAAYWPKTGRLEVHGAFPAEPGLRERGRKDGVDDLYLKMEERGELHTYPGKATNNVEFLTEMIGGVAGHKVLAVCADRYKQLEFEQAIAACGIGWEVEWRAVGKGPHGSADIRAFQGEVLDGFLKPQISLMMKSAINESRIKRDTNGNVALDKTRANSRIDALQAAVLATGCGRRWRFPPDAPKRQLTAEDLVLV